MSGSQAISDGTAVSRGEAHALVAVLTGAYVLSYADRQFLAVALESIRHDLVLDEIALGLLSGPAFALCYSLLGVPLGMLGDRGNRLRLIALCILVWSVATAACGLARGFGELFVARMAVGAGEAGLLPLAYSLMGQRFPAERLPLMVGIFIGGGAFGSGAAVLVGGPLLDLVPAVHGLAPWRMIFLGLGIAGLPVAALILRRAEPPRPAARALDGGGGLGTFLRGSPHLVLLAAGACMVNIMFYGLGAWVPAFFQRVHGWNPTQVGVSYGLLLLVCGVLANPFWGWAGARVIGRGGDVIRLMLLAAVLPLAMLVPFAALTPVPMASAAVFGCMPLLSGSLMTLVPAVIAAGTPAALRGRVMAGFFLSVNLVGIGGGPLAYAWLSGAGGAGRPGIAVAIAALTPVVLAACAALFLASRAVSRRAVSNDRSGFANG